MEETAVNFNSWTSASRNTLKRLLNPWQQWQQLKWKIKKSSLTFASCVDVKASTSSVSRFLPAVILFCIWFFINYCWLNHQFKRKLALKHCSSCVYLPRALRNCFASSNSFSTYQPKTFPLNQYCLCNIWGKIPDNTTQKQAS